MISPECKETVIAFLHSGYMRLSKNDLGFISNLHHVVVNKTKPVTSNQVKLLNQLISKYQRQLTVYNLSHTRLIELEFANTEIVESDTEYTEAYIIILDGIIYFKSPYNKKFLDAFRREPHNFFVWDKICKRHYAEYSTWSLKLLISIAKKFYSRVNYCPETNKLLNQIDNFDDESIWKPTLVKCNDRYYIIAANQSLINAMPSLDFTLDIKSASMLRDYGVGIHESLLTEKLEFGNSNTVTSNLEDLDKVIEWLEELGCDLVYFSGGHLSLAVHRKQINEKLTKAGIENKNIVDMEHLFGTGESGYDYPVLFQFSSGVSKYTYSAFNIKKQIMLVNNFPINSNEKMQANNKG